MRKILIVEDDQFIADIYKSKFQEEGFEVEVAKDGESALSKTKEIKPDIILLDLLLPDISGREIIKELKEERELKKIKVFVASNLEENKSLKQEFPQIHYFVKSDYTPSQLVDEIKKLI